MENIPEKFIMTEYLTLWVVAHVPYHICQHLQPAGITAINSTNHTWRNEICMNNTNPKFYAYQYL